MQYFFIIIITDELRDTNTAAVAAADKNDMLY